MINNFKKFEIRNYREIKRHRKFVIYLKKNQKITSKYILRCGNQTRKNVLNTRNNFPYFQKDWKQILKLASSFSQLFLPTTTTDSHTTPDTTDRKWAESNVNSEQILCSPNIYSLSGIADLLADLCYLV